MNQPQKQIPAEAVPRIFELAARLYAEERRLYSVDDLVQAGAESNIPAKYIHEAIAQLQPEVADPQPTSTPDSGRRRRGFRRVVLSLAILVGVFSLLSNKPRPAHRHYPDEQDVNRIDLQGADLSGKDLSGANFIKANLEGANLSGSNLSGANLSRANLEGANLSGANLHGANLDRANLEDANLTGANLTDANLRRSKLEDANLQGAILDQTNLKGADIEDARLP